MMSAPAAASPNFGFLAARDPHLAATARAPSALDKLRQSVLAAAFRGDLTRSLEIAHKSRRAALAPGDLVYSIVGTIGNSLIVPRELDGADITQSSVRIRPMAPLDAEYVLRALESPPVRVQMGRLMFGNAVQRLNVEHVRRLAVPLVPSGERDVVTERLRRTSDGLRSHGANVATLAREVRAIATASLAKAFRGELVPQDPNDEPASVLLERIRAERAASDESGTKKRGRARS